LWEYYDKYYHQLSLIIAEKVHQEKVQQEKLKEVKSRLNFEGCSGRNSRIQEESQHSESRTPNVRGENRRGRRSGRSRNMSGSPERNSVFSRRKCDRSESPRHRPSSRSRRMKLIPKKRYHEGTSSWRTEPLSKSEDSGGGHWKSRSRKQKSSIEEDDLLTRSTRVWLDDLPLESVDCYDDLKKAFLANFLQQWKCIKDPIEIHHIKQIEGESIKISCRYSRLRVGINKKLGENKILKKKVDFKNQQRLEQRRDKFTLLTKSLKEILALDKGKFKTPSSMTTPVENKNNNKLCEFHREVRHNTDECMHMRRKIEELIKGEKLSHVIKKLKQGSGKDQPKATKKGEASRKDKPLAILMVQPWKMVVRKKITQSLFPNPEISFLPLGDEDGAEGPVIIETKKGGYFIHRICRWRIAFKDTI
nr:reverse transcriptase domain-containing protein [Tanacetum cinerariifolium]